MIGKGALRMPAIKSVFESLMGQNPGNQIAAWWRAANPEMRQDFEFRRTKGDICWFRRYHVDRSLRTVSPAKAFPDNHWQYWVVD
jgi:hypothetical protein